VTVRLEIPLLLAGIGISMACNGAPVGMPTGDAATIDSPPASDAGGDVVVDTDPPPSDAAADAADGSVPPLGICEAEPACAGCGSIQCDDEGKPTCAAPAGGCEVFGRLAAPAAAEDAPFVDWGSGVALGDIDGDGFADAVYGTSEGLHILRWRAGRLEPWADGLVGRSPSHLAGLTLVDVDGDRDLDLFVTTQPPTPGVRFLENVAGRLVPVAVALPSMVNPGGPAWGDYDGDEDLDVFVPAYMDEPSRLLRNDGGWRFTDVAAVLGVDEPLAASLQGTWLDFDDDGDLDLLVSNDKGPLTEVPNRLFRNDGGTDFVEVGSAMGLVELVDGMGIAVADVDGDMDLDLYITDSGLSDGGQLFYVNEGDRFVERSVPWGVNAGRWFAWGTHFFDLDNDADLDLLVTGTEPGQTWLGEHVGERFVEIGEVVTGLPQVPQVGSAVADFDRDGRLDLGFFLWLSDEAAYFARNAHPSPGHYLSIALENRPPNTFGVGARAYVEAGGKTQMRALHLGSSFFSSDEPVLHFGLGESTTVDAVEIRWPDGERLRLEGPIEADQRLTVTR